MNVEFELLIILVVAVVFTVAGLSLEDYKQIITLKIFSAVAWFALALAFTASTPAYVAFSVLFLGVGIVMCILAIMDSSALLAEGKKAQESWWRE